MSSKPKLRRLAVSVFQGRKRRSAATLTSNREKRKLQQDIDCSLFYGFWALKTYAERDREKRERKTMNINNHIQSKETRATNKHEDMSTIRK